MKYIVVIMSLLMLMCGSSMSCGSSTSEINNSLKETQSINLSSIGNARELGGYKAADGRTVKHGVLLRTATLGKISSEDTARLIDVYHLSVDADLRTDLEVAANPDPVIDGVKYVNLNVIGEDAFTEEVEKKLAMEGDATARLKMIVDEGIISGDMYVGFLSSDSGKKAYSEFFRELLDLQDGHSLLFHCTQGKDRTGCAAMLILSALGVDEDTIMEDYLLTNVFNAEKIAAQHEMLLSHGMTESDIEKYMIVLDEVNPKTMNLALSWLKENYGSTLGYIINALGVSEAEIETLKAKFLE